MPETDQRIGMGFDVHPYQTDRPLILGGIEIRDHDGLAGHSDADALVHAICDALLGAAGLDDIGHQFPDTDEQYRGIRSTLLLKKVMDLLQEAGVRPVNIDSTVIAQAPKLSPHFPAMRKVLAPILGLGCDRIGIKATTNEGLRAWGHDEGIAAMAVCLIETA
ncbi:2-C-methyl-D-erythritol 2,4-cyclodiphosphate synthase [Candidatus Bipolaricaulota bacterium]